MGQSTSNESHTTLESEVQYPVVEVDYPLSAKFWIDHEHRHTDRGQWKVHAKKVVPWLINAIINAHRDPNIKRAAVQLMLVVDFTYNLFVMECWDPLRTGLILQLNTLGAQLNGRYTAMDLANVLSDQRIGCDKLKYHSMLSNKRQVHTHQLTHADLLPDLHTFFDFSGDHPETMDERVLLVVILMISKAVDAMFQKKTRKILRKCKTAVVRGAPIKQYARALNKALSDHLGKQQPRTAYNIDTLRALLMVSNPSTMIKAFRLLVKGFDGVAKVKNLFVLPEHERANRYHLLTLMLTCVVDSGMTFGEMAKDPHCQQLFDAFTAEIPHTEPKERWKRLCKRARDYLSHPSIANEKVCTYGEIQIILKDDALVRKKMHLVYKVIRAETGAQLHSGICQSYKKRPVEVKSKKLHKAVFRGQLSVVAALLDRGRNVDEENKNGLTPLFFAAECNHPDVMKLLIDRGASVNKPVNDRTTPLCIAVQYNFLDVIKLLISNNAAVDQTRNGYTPLCIASAINHLEVVDFLISSNAAIDKVSSDGRAPLNNAASEGNLEIAKVLVEAGADLNVKGKWGTPLKEAIDNGKVNVVEYLRQHNAKVE